MIYTTRSNCNAVVPIAHKNGASGSVRKGQKKQVIDETDPFFVIMTEYLSLMGTGVVTEESYDGMKRKYNAMCRDWQYLKEQKRVSTTNPAEITAKDIIAYIGLLRKGENHTKPLKDLTICKQLSLLKQLCEYENNHSVVQARRRYPALMPYRRRGRLPPVAKKDRNYLIEFANGLTDEKPVCMRGYAVCILGMCTGMRNKELRLANVSDISSDWVIHVEHVKGERRYGEPRKVLILPVAIPFLQRYLRVREEALRKKGVSSDVLFPHFDTPSAGKRLSSKRLSEQIRQISQETQVINNLRMCRRTFAQIMMDSKVPDNTQMRQMGHIKRNTLRDYYADQPDEISIEVMKNIFGELPMPQPSVVLSSPNSEKCE